MRRRLALVARLGALLGTSYFLVATSAPVEPHRDPGPNSSAQYCYHAPESLSFHVSGTCGPEGDIVVSSPVNECAIMVQGAAAVGLPAGGRFDVTSSAGMSVGLRTSTWHLSGYLAEGGAAGAGQGDAAVFTVARDAGADTLAGARPDGGIFTVVSDARADTGPFTVVTDAQPATALPHGKAALRTCTYGFPGSVPASLGCSDDGRAVCQAVLTLLP